MARRRKKEGLLEVLVMLPWWVSVVLAVIIFAAMRWFVPSLFAGKILLSGLSTTSQSLSWLPLVLFGATGAIAYFRQQATAQGGLKKADAFTFSTSRDEPYIRPARAIKPDVNRDTEGNPRSEAPAVNEAFDSWTLSALRALEWKRFELLCAKYYEFVGFKSETIRFGADGGIDVKLFKIDPSKPLAVVQCKAWNTYTVGVKEVRELLGVMAHEKVSRGIFITTSTFTKDALEFGAANPIQLLDGETFLKKITELSQEQQKELLSYAFEGDYSTPTCASCGIKMVKRKGKRGVFWGCLHYPRCKSTFPIKDQDYVNRS